MLVIFLNISRLKHGMHQEDMPPPQIWFNQIMNRQILLFIIKFYLYIEISNITQPRVSADVNRMAITNSINSNVIILYDQSKNLSGLLRKFWTGIIALLFIVMYIISINFITRARIFLDYLIKANEPDVWTAYNLKTLSCIVTINYSFCKVTRVRSYNWYQSWYHEFDSHQWQESEIIVRDCWIQ